MSYTSTFVAAFGAAGLTIHGQLYNSNGSTNGAAITSGVNEVGSSGTYIYDATIPESHRGMFRLYDSNNTAVFLDFAVSPQDTEPVPSAAEIVNAISAAGIDVIVASPLATSGDLSLLSHATNSFTFSALIPNDYTKIIFTLKRKLSDMDSEAILQINDTAGLVVLNGAAYATAAHAAVTVGAATISITIADNAMALLSPMSRLYYDLKCLYGSSSSKILASGQCSIVQAVTREI